MRGLVEGGVDILLPETAFDTLSHESLPVRHRQVLRGQRPALAGDDLGHHLRQRPHALGAAGRSFYISVAHFDALTVGLNCAVGADEMRPEIESLARSAHDAISAAIPTPACPTASAASPATSERWPALGEFARNGWVNIVGGCCGTTPEWIPPSAGRSKASPPRRLPELPPWSCYSGLEALVVRPETNFVMIGERTNITGSQKFARLIREGNYEEAVAVARQQVEAGANMLDVNMDEGMIDGEAAMTQFLNLVSPSPTSPACRSWSIARRWSVIEAGLKCVQGKAIVNSISLKEGEEKFLEQARLVRRYGAAVVVMAFDEEGQAVDRPNTRSRSASGRTGC